MEQKWTKTLGLQKNEEAERAIFSIILDDPDKFLLVADKLQVKDFYFITGQQIWSAFHSIQKQGGEIDVASVCNEIKLQGHTDYQLALKEISKCYENKTSASNLNRFVKDVKNASLLRQMFGFLNERLNETTQNDADAQKILGAVEKDIVSVNDNTPDSQSVEVSQILEEVKADMLQSQTNGWQGLKTGFSFIDEEIGGLIPSQVWIIGAYTGVGKTFLSLQLLINVLKGGGRVVLFSTEMDRKMNVMRILGNLAGLGTIRMMKGQLTDEEKQAKADAEELIKTYKDRLFIYDNVYTTEEIRLKAKKLKLTHGLDVIIVDFIQNLKGAESIYERMSQAAIDLQQIASELKITMVLVSQVSQNSAGWKENSEVIEYKGAGEIAAIADVGIWINKDKELKDIRWVHLRKVRHGSPGKFTVRISFPSGRIIQGPVPGAKEAEGENIFK